VRWRRGLAVACVVGLAGCASDGGSSTPPPEPSAEPPSAAAGPTAQPDRGGGGGAPTGPDPVREEPERSATPGRLQQLVDEMALDELAHRVQVVSVAGTRPRRVTSAEGSANLADFGARTPAAVMRTFRPGGVIYFDHNVGSVRQVRRLSAGLHQAAQPTGAPTLLGVDQEGGSVSRLPGPAATGQPAARDLGGDPRFGRSSARRVGRAMAAMGLDVDFAPVADVDTVGGAGVIGERSFGTTSGVVAPMVRAQVCGYHRGGVGVSLKHWPGHGSTSVDSHDSLPTLTLPTRTWRREHLPSFVAGISGGADMVMTGHLAYPALDPSGDPASLSRTLTHDWLRQRLGFDGVVVTDALDMAAIAGRGTPGEIAVLALRAGADLLLMSPSPQGATAGIRAAVADGRLSRERLESSVLRVLRLADATAARGPAGC